jgi:hypothetical protein
MNDLASDQPMDEGQPASLGLGSLLVGGLTLVVIGVGLARIAAYGWATVAPDDARYLYTGLSTLAGNGPVTSNGVLLLLRSPAYGFLLAAGAQPFGDPLSGARIVAATIGIAAFIGAIRLSWLIGGPAAAAGTALSIIAMPLAWRLLPTLRIDLPQTAGVIAVLLAIHRPTMRRWVLAGFLLGLTVLVKETVLLLAGLPVAGLGLVPMRRLAALSVAYLAAAVAVAGWWWVLVWLHAGVVFPANAIGAIEARQVGSDIRIDAYGLVLVVVAIASWSVLAWRARQELASRFIVLAGAALAVPAAYATLNGLSSRNYVGLAVLSTVAIGVAAATIGRWLVGHRGASPRSHAVVWAAIGLVLVVGGVAGQRTAGRPSESSLPSKIDDWLRPRLRDGGQVVMSFRYSDVTALALYGLADVPELPISRYRSSQPLDAYLWLGLRDEQLFGFQRAAWAEILGDPRTTHLVLAGPHAFTPAELFPALDHGLLPGVSGRTEIVDDREWARIYAIDPGLAGAEPDLPLHLSPRAALAWLDAADDASARKRLADALISLRPVLVGPNSDQFLENLPAAACLVPAGEGKGALRLGPKIPSVESQPGAICHDRAGSLSRPRAMRAGPAASNA